MSIVDRYPDTDPSEEVVAMFDFSGDTASVTAPVVHAYVGWTDGTTDPTPETMLSGAAYVQGAKVYQLIVPLGHVPMTDYVLTCLATTAENEKLMVVAILPLRTKKDQAQ